FGCRTVESDSHLFVECPRFNGYRVEAGEQLCARIGRRLARTPLGDEDTASLRRASEVFYGDTAVRWPMGFPQFYLGHVPALRDLVPRVRFASDLEYNSCVTACESDWHFAAIQLAG
ncbi:hypothetical protein AURDEDRAFT_73091, partial [Auricularia subglabra TFB-10046 SS5]